MIRFSQLVHKFKQRFHWFADAGRNNRSRFERRRLFLEPLQAREVLAVAVTALTPTPSGFVAELNNDIKQDILNLYDEESDQFGAADVTLTGATTGNVKGSVVIDDHKLIFIATGGALPADTYTVTLRSATDGIVDQALGQLLDGEFSGTFPSGNGTVGGNFVFNFTAAPKPLVVSMPDFARGPTQDVNAPAAGSGVALPTGLPIQFSNANGVTSFSMTVTFDPALLNITDAELGANAPTGSQVEINTSTPGQVTIAFFSLNPIGNGPAKLVNLIAKVPDAAPYGAAQVLDVTFLEVNAGAIEATADDAFHVVAFPGDANSNRRYDAEDARLIARTGVGLDSGFVTDQPTSATAGNRLFPTFDPVVIGDVTGVDGLSPLDASDVLRAVVGLSTPNLPALPVAQAPTGLSLSSTNVEEHRPAGTIVGTFTTTDPDLSDTHTYTLVSGEGSTNNSLFTISGTQLKTAAELDRATQSSLSIRVRTTDSSGKSLEKTFTITVTVANRAPTAVAISNNTVAESIAVGNSVGTLTTTDPDTGNTHTYTLVTGTGSTDNASFSIAGNSLQVAQALNFETKPTYSVRVRSTDQGGLFFEQVLTITVTNVNEAPTAVALSNSSVAASQPVGTVVGNFSSTDPDASSTHTYSLVTGTGDTDNSSFTITGNQLKTNAVLPATPTSRSIRVRTTDNGGLTFDQVLNITVTAANVAPTDLALSSSTVTENVTVGTPVGNLTTTDANSGDTHTYTLVTGTGSTDNAAFTIVDNQLRTNAAVNFETKNSYNIRVRSTDQGGLFFEEALTITVTNVNEAPTAVALSSTAAAENAAVGAVVGNFSSTDADSGSTHTYTLVTGDGSADNASFTVSGNQLKTAAALNFETKATYNIRVQSTDQGGLSTQQTFTITVTNVNEAPTAVALSSSTIAQGQPVGTTVGILTSTDPDASDTHTYSLVTGTGDTGNSSFTINGNQLKSNVIFSQATQSSFSIRVRSTDAGGLTTDQVFTITVTETNVAPTAVALSSTSVSENVDLGTTVGAFSTTDANTTDTHAYTLVSGIGDTDNAAFTTAGNLLRTAAAVNFENKDSYSIRVRSTDPFSLFVEQTFTITVTNVNEAPTALALSSNTIAEDAASGAAVGTFSTTDPDTGNTHTYSLVAGTGGTDNGSFTIVDNQLRTNGTLDFETKSSYSVRVQSADQGGLTAQQTFTISVTNVNEAPTALALSNNTLAETAASGSAVGTFTTTDPDSGNTHTYSLVTGAGDTDNAAFTIVDNQLRTNGTLDFETKSSYSVRVQSADQGGLTTQQTFTISVTNVNEAPTALALSSSTIGEDAASGSTVGTFSTTDPDTGNTHTYSLVAGEGDADNDSFTIVGAELRTTGTLDFETKSSYSIRVQSADQGGLNTQQTFTVSVTNVNEAPTALALSSSTIAEDAASGSVVGAFSTTDPDSGNTHTYSLVAGEGDADNASFAIVDNELRTAGTLDFETKSSYSIRVQSADQGGLNTQQTFTVTVTNVNEAPTAIALSSNTVAEDAASGSAVGTFSTTDPDSGNTHTYSLVAGEGDADNASFAIVDNELRTAGTLDFETNSSYSIRVQSADQGGLTTQQTFAVTVTNVNEAPTALALSSSTVAEDAASGSAVGTFSTTDPDTGNTHTYSLVAGEGDADNASFAIVDNELRTAGTLDFETKSSYSIRVQSADQGGLITQQSFTVSVTNVNEAPTAIALSSNTVAEDAASGSAVGTFSTTDPDSGNTHTYSLVAGEGDADNASFAIVDNELRTAGTLDFETKSSYSIRVQSADQGGLITQQSFTVSVTNVNEAPTAIALSSNTVAEDAASGSAVGTFSTTDPDSGNTHTYSLVAGEGDADNGSFTIVDNELRTAGTLDFETKSSYSIRVQSADQGGLDTQQTFTISVINVNEAPAALALSNSSIAEDAASGSAVGTFSTTDPDAGDTHTYTFVAGEGDADNASFTIVDNELRTAGSLDFETKSSYSIRVQSADQGGLNTQQTFTVSVTNVNEAPTAIALSSNTIPEDAATGSAVGTLSTTDPDAGNTHTYTLVAGEGDADNASFTIVDNELRTAGTLDFETKSTYSVRVQSDDQGGLITQQSFTVSITNVNEAPSAFSLGNSTIAEDAATGSAVGTFSTSDPDSGDTHTYTLVAGEGDADNASFTIVDNELRTAGALDFETQSSYSIRVQSEDQGGLSTQQTLTISVTNVNEAPTAIALSNGTIAEDAASGSTVGTFSTTDPDSGDTHTYTLVVGEGDTDNASFTIVDNELRTANTLDFETKSSYSIRVQSVDQGGLSTHQILTVNVTNVNEAPTAIVLSNSTVAEDVVIDTVVGTFSTADPDAGDTHNYSLVAGDGDTDNAAFVIVGNELRTAVTFDFETKSSYSIRVRSTDNAGASFEQIFTISISDVVE